MGESTDANDPTPQAIKSDLNERELFFTWACTASTNTPEPEWKKMRRAIQDVLDGELPRTMQPPTGPSEDELKVSIHELTRPTRSC